MTLRRCAALAIVGLLVMIAAPAQASGHEGTITEFPAPAFTRGMAVAPDGSLWFTEGNEVVRRGLDGTYTRYPISRNHRHAAVGITAGPRHSMWFAEGSAIGRITRSGDVKRYRLADPDAGALYIAAGPDGNLWFTEYGGDAIGRLTPTGTLTEFPLGVQPVGITAGPDGNLWFSEAYQARVGRITPSGVATDFVTSYPASDGITSGPDGALWFSEVDHIGRLTTTGQLTEFPVHTKRSTPLGITTGADGNLWFTEHDVGKIGRITPAGHLTEFPLPVPSSGPWSIVAGSDGNLWFSEGNVSRIGRITDRPAATLNIDPGEGPPGTEVIVNGTSYGAFERVRVVFVDEDNHRTPLANVMTNAHGAFSATVAVPTGVEPGSHAIAARGTTSGIRRLRGFSVTA